MESNPVSPLARSTDTGKGVGETIDQFLPPARWQLVVRPIRRFGTIDRLTWLLDGVADISAVKIRRLDRGVAIFDIFYRGQFTIETLLTNALAPLGAAIVHSSPGRVEVGLDTGQPSTGDAYAFDR